MSNICSVCNEIDCNHDIWYVSHNAERVEIANHGVVIVSEDESALLSIEGDRLIINEPQSSGIEARRALKGFAISFPQQQVSMLRIHDPDYTLQSIVNSSSFNNIVAVDFMDIDRRFLHVMYDDGRIRPEHGTAIVDFFTAAKDDFLVIHCWAGVSRSSAVAMAYAAFRGDRDLWEKIRHSPWYHPNQHVLLTLLDELTLRGITHSWAATWK